MEYVDNAEDDDDEEFNLEAYEKWADDIRNDHVSKDEEWDSLWWYHVFEDGPT